MSNVYFISDLHLGHKNILNFAGKYREGKDVQEHDRWVIKCINSIVTKRDLLWILGDIAWNNRALGWLFNVPCKMKFILGNHDKMLVQEYMKYGKVMRGLVNYKGFWLSHAPIHPDELRGRMNIHGHVHFNTILDPRYINVCVEPLKGMPISLGTVLNMKDKIGKLNLF